MTSSPARAPLKAPPAWRDVADAPPDLLRLTDHVVARHGRGPGGRPKQRGQHPQGRRLAGAVGPQEADHLTLGHVEVHPVDGANLRLAAALLRVEGLRQTSCTDHIRFPRAGLAHSVFKLE